jgi:3-hydroxyisobutyryl-CoA hydrolase
MNSATAEDEVKFSSSGAVRTILLNRPKKLNSLNHNMVELIVPRLQEWAKSDNAKIIVLKGEGEKSLCAGGDVAALATLISEKGDEGSSKAADYFRDEYQLDHFIATYPKPFVALQDGITMGGGVGLSIHAPFRIATERMLFAMPETNIGFFPDVGGTFFLSRLDGQLGAYLGLTSARLKGYDAFYAGIATHYVPSHRIGDLEARLAELHSTNASEDLYNIINSTIEEYCQEPPKDYKFILSEENREIVDTCFSHDTVEEILAALERNGSEFALQTKKTILERSPTSVKVTLAAIRRGKNLDIKKALDEEYYLAENFAFGPDFVEGVTALLVSKPSRKPNWNPATVEDVSSSEVARFLAHRPNGASGIEFLTHVTYQSYPHQYGLPSDEDVKAYVVGESSSRDFKATRKEVLEHFLEVTNGKVGVEHKVNTILDGRTKEDPENPGLLDWIY